MLLTLTMVTSAFNTPAAAAIAVLKVACLPSSNSATVMGSDTAAVTTKGLTVVTLAEDGLAVQGPPATPEYPALHVQAVQAVLSAGEPKFAGQLSHLTFPLPVVYVPATHFVHNPSRLEDPALDVQAVRVTLPAGESALAGQLLQLASPRVVLYDPATHTVHIHLPSPRIQSCTCRL